MEMAQRRLIRRRRGRPPGKTFAAKCERKLAQIRELLMKNTIEDVALGLGIPEELLRDWILDNTQRE